ncbi:MAG: hypothetical protein QXY95_04135 [Thermosphaera sp.]
MQYFTLLRLDLSKNIPQYQILELNIEKNLKENVFRNRENLVVLNSFSYSSTPLKA